MAELSYDSLKLVGGTIVGAISAPAKKVISSSIQKVTANEGELDLNTAVSLQPGQATVIYVTSTTSSLDNIFTTDECYDVLGISSNSSSALTELYGDYAKYFCGHWYAHSSMYQSDEWESLRISFSNSVNFQKYTVMFVYRVM